MSGAFFSGLHPQDWFKGQFDPETESVDVLVGLFILWLALIALSYVLSLLSFWALKALGIIKEGLYLLFIG